MNDGNNAQGIHLPGMPDDEPRPGGYQAPVLPELQQGNTIARGKGRA